MKNILTVATLTSILTACSTVYDSTSNNSPNLSSINDLDLCAYIGYRDAPPGVTFANIQREVLNRELLTEAEWKAVQTRRPIVGMS